LECFLPKKSSHQRSIEQDRILSITGPATPSALSALPSRDFHRVLEVAATFPIAPPLAMSRDRKPRPELQRPFTASIQVKLQQDLGLPQRYDLSQAITPTSDHAEAHYKRAGELRTLRRFDDALSSLDSAIALKPDHAEAHNSRGIVLANLNRVNEALDSFNKAIALRADYAEAYNNRGLVLQDLKRLDDALVDFKQAIALRPDNPSVHNNFAVALREFKRLDEALDSSDKAIALNPDYAEAHYNRALILQDLGRLDDALAGYKMAIALKPNYAAAYVNLGVALQELRRPEDALAAYDQAKLLSGDHIAEANTNQSYCFLQLGRFEQGWRLHEWRKRLVPPVAGRSLPQPLWLGTDDIANKTLFIHWEQGLGDTIQFCRYGKLLKARGAKVVMSVQAPLYRLLQQMSPDIQVVNHDEVPTAFDYHCPMMSLPLAVGTKLKDVPSQQRYIFADEQQRKAWDVRLPPRTKPRIGIVWSGSAKHKNDRNRSIDLLALAPLFSTDAHWISLQKELRHGEAALLQQLRQIVFYGDDLSDFSDTAAVIDLLDLLITVDTSVAHLAGAMGKPVWILLPFNADWRWLLGRDDSPWYPSARLFRQQEAGAWGSVMTRVQAALRDFILSRS
jgi:tetratricopeptide (TPR) repeat protein